MKFAKLTIPKGMRPVQAEHYLYSVCHLATGEEAFTDRRPSKRSKYWGADWFVWDNKNNCQISTN